MTPTPAVAPYVPSYANRVPYITVGEFQNAPTGVDASQLVVRGSYNDNLSILGTMLARASGWVDAICHQVLACTPEVQVGRYRIRRDGSMWVPLAYSPVVAVTDVSWGYTTALTAMTDLSGVWIEGKIAQVPLTNINPSVNGAVASDGTVYAQVGYLAGFPNTVLAAAALVGDSTVTVTSGLGIPAGMPMTLFDAAQTEGVTVASGHAFNSTTVELSAPLTYAHDAGTAISALPDQVKQATISLAAALIKTRGAQALSMPSMSSQPSKKELIGSGGNTDVEVAEALLCDFIRVR